MSKELREMIEKLSKEKKSLPECVRKREISEEILELEAKIEPFKTSEPNIAVKYAGKQIGKLEYDSKESSWYFKGNDGSTIEVGFQYHEARGWASMNGYQLKVERI